MMRIFCLAVLTILIVLADLLTIVTILARLATLRVVLLLLLAILAGVLVRLIALLVGVLRHRDILFFNCACGGSRPPRDAPPTMIVPRKTAVLIHVMTIPENQHHVPRDGNFGLLTRLILCNPDGETS
ncbi:hypothetical protein [Sphingopyxis sp.]|uniref:hypothetical protein n=1 Tax=Sphingopyxis sp. TaxID=1908224 RepID=UPI0035B3A847